MPVPELKIKEFQLSDNEFDYISEYIGEPKVTTVMEESDAFVDMFNVQYRVMRRLYARIA